MIQILSDSDCYDITTITATTTYNNDVDKVIIITMVIVISVRRGINKWR